MTPTELMAATTEQFKTAMLPLYREMIDTATEIQAESSTHRAHLALALQLMEKANDLWWSTYRADPMVAALDQTLSMARCSCRDGDYAAIKAIWA